MNILAKIAAEKQREVAEAKRMADESQLRKQAELREGIRDFRAALQQPGRLSLIAEVKKASPSAGVISRDFQPVSIAREFEKGGADACSVLTDEKFFHGNRRFLSAIRGEVRFPLLRKDFIIDEYQIYESSACGADAILLIVALLDEARLKDFLAITRQCRMAALVEIHDEAEQETAIQAGADILGINNRNLKDFSVDLGTTERLAARIRQQNSRTTRHDSRITLVAESGIHSREDVERVQAAGVDAILVGESLMRAPDIGRKIAELVGSPKGDPVNPAPK
jgi:indole-3-glycerol phosphate synthase